MLTLPPGVDRGGVRHAHVGTQAQARQVFADARCAGRVDLQRRDGRLGPAFQQMRRLATRRGTGVQHMRRSLGHIGQQQRCRTLRCRRLHRSQPVKEAGQLAHRAWLAQSDGRGTQRVGLDVFARQQGQVIRHAAPLRIDSQVHRRSRLRRRQDGLPMRGVIAAKTFRPPAGMVPARHRIDQCGLRQRLALTQEASQTGVEQPGMRAQSTVALGRLDRLVHQRKRLIHGTAFGLREREAGAEQRIRQRRRYTAHQLAAQRIRHAQPAQHVK